MLSAITFILYSLAFLAQALTSRRWLRTRQLFFIFGLSAVTVHGWVLYQANTNPKDILHIILSVVTFGVLLIAGLQAVTLAFQEKYIRQKSLGRSQNLPPLETTEKTLFQLITIGCVLLGILLITSVYFYHPILQRQFLQKTILTFITWLVFSLLLFGRYYFGWRGKKAIYWTLSGVVLLSVIYFSSMIIMELLP